MQVARLFLIPDNSHLRSPSSESLRSVRGEREEFGGRKSEVGGRVRDRRLSALRSTLVAPCSYRSPISDLRPLLMTHHPPPATCHAPPVTRFDQIPAIPQYAKSPWTLELKPLFFSMITEPPTIHMDFRMSPLELKKGQKASKHCRFWAKWVISRVAGGR